jgi:hypothetical protein
MRHLARPTCALLLGLTLGCSSSESNPGSGGNSPDAGLDATQDVGVDVLGDDALPEADADDDAAAAKDPSVDGIHDEWSDIDLLVTDPEGDATGGFDVTNVWAINRGTSLYLRAQVASEPLNMLAGPPEQGTLVIELGLPGERRLSVNLREHAFIADGMTQLRWSEVAFQIAPTTASTELEAKLDLAALGVAQGDEISVDFSGSDSLSSPVSFVMGADPMVPQRGEAARAEGTQLRVAALNVWIDGLTAAGQTEPMGRLLKAAAADIYCLQEMFLTPPSAIAARLGEIDPHGDGATWNVHRTGDTAVATRGVLTALPHDEVAQPPYSGAGIELPGGLRVMVFSPRPKCCGYAGDPSDQQRISEFQHLAATIADLRNGALGVDFEPFVDAPIIVMGDWNLVGSATPVELMSDPAGPGLERWLLRHLVGDGAIYTWRSDGLGGFPPGALDVLAYGSVDPSKTLKPLAGYVLDSEELDATTLEQLGLLPEDSKSSDHLLLVADFGL